MSARAADQQPTILVITHVVPRPHAGNAGQNFVSAQVQRWSENHHVSCLVLPGRSAREELDEATVPCHVIQVPRGRLAQTLMSPVHRIRRLLPSLAEPDIAYGLLTDPQARLAIREADIIVLQWQSTAALAPLIRRMNPGSPVIAVFHDVMSQSHARFADQAGSRLQKARHRVAAGVAKLVERSICRTADCAVILSEKDRRLLPPTAQTRAVVVPAPVEAPATTQRRPVPGRVINVSSWRLENVRGMEWFTQEVIPILRGHNLVLDVHLIGSMTPELKERFEAEGYTVRGFVDNLAAEYTLAQVAIVPLWLGAGVKFKTVEAALHGVPLVSTSVGAEGIPALSGQPQVSDDAGEFAAAIIEAMRLPDVAQRGADLLRDRILDQHGPDAVNSALDAVLAGLRQPTKR